MRVRRGRLLHLPPAPATPSTQTAHAPTAIRCQAGRRRRRGLGNARRRPGGSSRPLGLLPQRAPFVMGGGVMGGAPGGTPRLGLDVGHDGLFLHCFDVEAAAALGVGDGRGR